MKTKINKLKKSMKLKKEEKRKAIISAAIKIFSEKGFHAAKISEIAKLAKVSDGTTYIYFKNKDDLLLKTFDELLTNNLEKMKISVMKVEKPIERLRKFLDLHVELFEEFPHFARFLAIELKQSPQFYTLYPDKNPFDKYLDFLKKLCDDTINSGEIRKINTKALTYLIFGTINFLLTEWVVMGKNFSLEEMKIDILDIVHNGLKI